MKNRYCIFCGTLLPEDGVCLRCGAKYQLADDGQLQVIPRKVKKVSAKTTPKKSITVKAKPEPYEAETQTTPILEDVYSFSDEYRHEEKHTDWTSDSNVNNPEKRRSVPEVFGKSKIGVSNRQGAEKPKLSTARKRAAIVSTKTLVAVLLLTAMLSTCLVYGLWRRSYNSRNASSINKISTTDTIGSNTSAIKSENSKELFDIPSFTCFQGEEAIEAHYTYTPETRTLTIDHNGMDYSGMYMLPLVDFKSNQGESLIPLSIWSLGDCPVLGFLFSDWITSGTIERIIVNSSYSGNGNSERRTEDYHIRVDQGLVRQVECTMDYKSYDQDNESGDSHEATVYTFDYDKTKTLVSETIVYNTNFYQSKDQRTFLYDENSCLQSIGILFSQNQGTSLKGGIEVTKDSLGRIVSIDQSFESDEEAPPIGYDYFYNEAGYVTKVNSHEAPDTTYLEYDSDGRVKTVTFMGQ